jgi:phage minor structural protein
MKTTDLYIFDGKTDLLLTVLSNKDNEQCPYREDESVEKLNDDFTFEFVVPNSHEDSQHLVDGNRVVYRDIDGNYQEFQIYMIEDTRAGTEFSKRVYCEHAIYEIADDIVEDLRVVNGPPLEAMTKALSSSIYIPGQVDALGNGTVNFYYSDGIANLNEVVKAYGGELRYRVTLSSDKKKIQSRLVDLLVRRGADNGKRFEHTKDMKSVKRKVDRSGLKTALFVRGNGEEIEDTGGYTRKVTIENVQWSTQAGDPVDKPLGQKWIGDPTALSRFGRANGTRHRFGTFDVESTDPAEIIREGWKALQEISTPKVTYEVEAQDLELFGFSHESVRLGDTVYVIDKGFTPALRISARVVEIKRSLSDPYEVSIILGNFYDVTYQQDVDLEKEVRDLKDRKGVWDKVEDDIGDGDFADITPPAPTNLKATGLFKSIAVEWDFNPSSYIATYEVYGSKTNNFVVGAATLLFKGKVGGYVHKANTNETWYFRVRAVNTHGTTSSITAQVSGSTIRIATADYTNLSVTNAIIGNLAVDTGKIADLAVTNAKIKDLNVDKVTAGLLRAQFVEIGSETTYKAGYDPSTKATPQDIKDYTKPVFNEVYDPTFQQGKQFWSDVYTGLEVPSTSLGTIVDSTDGQSSGKLWAFQGDRRVFSKNPIPVNVNRVYRVTFRVRQTVNPTTAGLSKVYAGVATLGKDFEGLTGGAGSHRYCAVASVPITTADGWQTFTGLITGEGDAHNSFRPGTKYVRPMFIVGYQAGDGTVEVDMIDFEDVTEIQRLEETVNEVSLKVNDDSIISTVTNSVKYSSDLSAKADQAYLQENYPDNDTLDSTKGELEGKMDQKISDLNLAEVYATKSEVQQTADALDFKFTKSGGVNLLKNSVGYAGGDFWTPTLDKDGNGFTVGGFDTIQTEELKEIGSGSGFVMDGAKLSQTVVSGADYITLSTMVKKGSAGTAYLKITYDNGTVRQVDLTSGTTYTYEPFTIIIEPNGNTMTVELYGSKGSNTIFTNTIMNVGNVPLQWQPSSGEVYNTNVLMDLNGIKVFSNQYEGYTAITPEEFSGYALVDGEMTRVFTLNKDTTEVSKLKADKEISMPPVKIVTIEVGSTRGWAFIADND